jgi:cytochrome c-type biogenesis protein CcmH/NrfG
MAVINAFPNAIVGLVIVVVIIGIVLGLAVSGTDLLNPKTSAAKRDELAEKIRHEAELNRLEEQRIAAEIERENEHRQQKMELDLKLWPIRVYALTAGAMALVIVAIGVAILLARLGYRWSGLAQQTSRPTADQNEDVWKVRAYRDTRIQMARDNERYSREALSPKPVTQDQFASGDDGHRQEPSL